MKTSTYILIFWILLAPASVFAATGNVRVISAVIAEDGRSATVAVEYMITSDDVPEAHSTYNTNGFYKECFSPTLDLSDSCNTHRYAYFKRSTQLTGTFGGSSSVERFWCPGGSDDMGVNKSISERLTIPPGTTGGAVVNATYYLQDVAGYGSQLYYGQIYSCRTSTSHPDYTTIFASATAAFKISDDGQSIRCVDADSDGFYSISPRCSEGSDCDDNDPEVGEVCPVEISPAAFPQDCKLTH